MKVGMVTTTGSRCGIAAYTRALVAGLESLPDTEVEVIPITEGRQSQEFYQAQADRLNAPDIDVVHIQHEHSFWGSITPASSDYLALLRLTLKIDKVSPSSTYWNFRYLLKKPIVLTAHTTYSVAEMLKVATETSPLKKWIKERMLANEEYRDSVESAPFATGVTLVHTEAARQALIERGAKPNYVVVVPTGLPAPVPAPTAGAAFRERFGLADRRLITIFGYLVFNKGYELTLEVLPSLPDNVTLVIAGGARNADMEPYAEGLRAQIAASGLENRVVITGYLEETEVAEAMAASEIVLAPHTVATGSYSVTVPLTYGKPTLSSDLDCFQEIARRGDAVAMFRAGDTADYREKLLALLNSPEEQTRLAAAAQRYADRFAWPKVAGLTRTIYKNAIDVYSRGHHPHMVSL